MNRIRHFLSGGLVLVVSCLPAGSARAAPTDPLGPLLQRVDAFLRREESDGVTLESRHLSNFPEQIRLTVVAQLLGYAEYYRAGGSSATRQDLVDRADFLVRYGEACRGFDAADGMLAYALLRAYELLGDPRYREAAEPIVAWCRSAPGIEQPLNRGLMAALALAQHHRLTGDPVALTRVRDIVLLAARSQHGDGSFAHVCDASRDVHYTAWISMELDRIGELVDDPNVDRVLVRSWAFLQGRVSGDGEVSYQHVLPTGGVIYYYSQPVCPSDYDTRGWVNELAYHALLFDRYQDGRYHGVMARLSALGPQGAFPDKWDYWPPPGDPGYLWASSPRSVIRTSVAFWALAAVQARRSSRGQVAYPVVAGATARGAEDTLAGAEPAPSAIDLVAEPLPEAASLAPPRPNPARGGAWIELQAGRGGEVRLAILDAAGRRVRTLLSGPQVPGARRVHWDGHDDRGSRVAPGVYFVRLEAEGRAHRARLVLLD